MARPYTSVTTHLELDAGPRQRASAFFRPLLLIPAAVLLVLLGGGGGSDRNRDDAAWLAYSDSAADGGHWSSDWGNATPALWIAIMALIVLMGRYPTWILTFVHGVQSFATKCFAYALLVRDEYPHVDERPYAYVLFPDIEEGRGLSRGLPLVKWFLAIPHYLLLALATVPIIGITVVAWLSILVTGRYPASLFPVIAWYLGYGNRVYGYAFALVSDSYPRITE